MTEDCGLVLGGWPSGPCLPCVCKLWADHPAQEGSGLCAGRPLGTERFHPWPHFSFGVVRDS